MGSGGVQSVRLVRTERGFEMAGAFSREFPWDRDPHPSEIEAVLKQTADSLLVEGARLAVGLRARESSLHFIEVPFDNPDKVGRVLKYEAEPHFLTPVDDLLLDYLPLDPLEDGTKPGVVFGAAPAAVGQAMESLEEAEIEAEAVLPDLLGLLAAGRYFFKDDSEGAIRLLADLGAGHTGLAVFDGGRPIAARSFYYGGRDISKALAEALELDPYAAENLKRQTNLTAPESKARQALHDAWQPIVVEIGRTLAAALVEREAADPTVVVCGGGSQAPGLIQFLARRLELDVLPLTDFTRTLPSQMPFSADLASAFGLALLSLGPGRRPNLRQGELAPFKAFQRHRTPLTVLAVGIVLFLAINLGGLVASYRGEINRNRAVKKEIEQVFRKTLPGVTKVVAPLTQMRQEVQKVGGTLAATNPEGGRALDVLLEVSRVTSRHGGVRITDLNLSRDSLELSGEGGSFEVIDHLKSQLAGLPFFSETTLRGARMDPETKVLTFKISLKRVGG